MSFYFRKNFQVDNFDNILALLLGLNAQKSIPHDSTHFGKGIIIDGSVAECNFEFVSGFSDPFGVPQNTGAQDQSSDIGQGRSVSSGSPDAASQDYQLIGQGTLQ